MTFVERKTWENYIFMKQRFKIIILLIFGSFLDMINNWQPNDNEVTKQGKC